MNAVLEPKVAPAASQTFDQITQHLTALSAASSGCQQVLAQSQTLREWVSERLREGISQVRAGTDLAVSNPDAIFCNRAADDAMTSTGMTDLLIETLRAGTSLDETTEGGFYTRHATLDETYALTAEQNQHMRQVLEEMAPTVFADYGVYLRDHWEKMIHFPGMFERIESVANTMVSLHREGLKHEFDLRVACRAMSASDRSRLSSVVVDGTVAGVYGVSLNLQDAGPAALLPVYVVSSSNEEADEPSAPLFLVMPCKGVEAFESLDSLRETLSRRLSLDTLDPHLVGAMTLSDQARLALNESIPADAWRFEPLAGALLEAHLQFVQTKQAQDFAYLLKQSTLDAAVWHERLDAAQLCRHLDEALGHRFNLLSVRADAFMAPHWRKFAEPDDQRHLLELEKRHRMLKQDVAQRLAGVESFTVFVFNELASAMQNRLGCSINPNAVTLTLEDTIALGGGHSLSVKYEKTLLEFATTGLPHTSGPLSFAPVTHHLHAEFTEPFVRTLLADLNLHHRYGIALREAYEDVDNLRQLVKHRDSAIALGAFTASKQGHLIQERSHELLSMIRGDRRKNGSTYSIGSLYLLETHTRFNDFIVFQDKAGSDEHYVLYAPGAPRGQDFFEFGSWRQLCFKVGEWLATEAGRSYVHTQLTGPTESGHAAVINNVHLKPSLWGPNSCLFVRCTGSTFEQNLADLISQKVSRTLQAAERAAPLLDSQTSFASPSVQALMEARIEALNAEFTRISDGLIDYRRYVHAHMTSVLNAFLRDNGYTRNVDPDTLYLGLGEPYDDAPEFGEHTELHQLTRLVMDGSEDILSHRPQVHLYSSTGLDVTTLPVTVFHFIDKQIRELDLGAKYMNFMEREFLGRQSPLYARRKLLMAKRLQYEMSRGALKEFMRGRLSERQYAWLRRTIIGLDQDAAIVVPKTAVSSFTIAGQIIEGVYIFRDFNTTDPDFNLLYTPDAPDGFYFRQVTDYAQLLESVAMQNYYYSRSAYMGQPRVGSFFDRLERGGKFDEDFIRVVNRMENRIADAQRMYGDMLERMIADVDAQTESHAEARFSTTWTVIQWLGTMLSIPFPVISIGWGIFTSAVKVYQGLDAYLSGDRAAALPLLLEGVFGLATAGNSALQLFNALHLAARGAGVPTGVWVWNALEAKGKFQEAVNEYLLETGVSLIVE